MKKSLAKIMILLVAMTATYGASAVTAPEAEAVCGYGDHSLSSSGSCATPPGVYQLWGGMNVNNFTIMETRTYVQAYVPQVSYGYGHPTSRSYSSATYSTWCSSWMCQAAR